MKQGKILLVAAILTAMFMLAMNVASRAQQPAPQTQALNQMLSGEISQRLQCLTDAFTLKGDLDKAQAEVKRLTDKYESKPEAKPESKK